MIERVGGAEDDLEQTLEARQCAANHGQQVMHGVSPTGAKRPGITLASHSGRKYDADQTDGRFRFHSRTTRKATNPRLVRPMTPPRKIE